MVCNSTSLRHTGTHAHTGGCRGVVDAGGNATPLLVSNFAAGDLEHAQADARPGSPPLIKNLPIYRCVFTAKVIDFVNLYSSSAMFDLSSSLFAFFLIFMRACALYMRVRVRVRVRVGTCTCVCARLCTSVECSVSGVARVRAIHACLCMIVHVDHSIPRKHIAGGLRMCMAVHARDCVRVLTHLYDAAMPSTIV